jgi:hypothetical protein
MEKAACTKRYSASEDQTGLTYQKLKELSASKLVLKVWLVNGRLRFTLPGNKIILRVKSVFSSVAEIVNAST